MIDNTLDILIVEDNKYNAEFILEALEKNGIVDRAKVFQDGEEALNYLFAAGKYADRDSYKQPRVILLDLKLPKMDGLEVLRRIRSNELTNMIPVVVFSSSTEDGDRLESYRLGANSYIIKPVSYERFVKSAAEIGMYWALLNVPPTQDREACLV
ncbi:MAG TPA: response regulator [Syntrophales bacterium]|nr:response regulator [Syntrophales bacterium]